MALGRSFCAVGACVAALSVASLGCGAEEHVNDPRPSAPVRVSVAIHSDSITVTPPKVGLGPERSKLIEQNEDQPQPAIETDEPLTVVFVSANLTRTDSSLEISGPKDTSSGLLVANGSGSYQAALPSGRYTVGAADIPGAKPASFTVGPYRASSQNDVLLP
jgi:hypothetical protein